MAVAGPAINFVLAVISALLCKMLLNALLAAEPGDILPNIAVLLLAMLHASVWINLVLCIFNLLPVPPLDGSRILAGILPPSMAQGWIKIERYGFVILLVLMMTGVIGRIISPFINTLSQLLLS